MNNEWKIYTKDHFVTRNFKISELTCNCGCRGMPLKGTISRLQDLRDKWGKAVTITSGYRCKAHNRHVGGAINSQHVTGRAADLWTKDMTPEKKAAFVFCAGQAGWTTIGIYKDFIHVDWRKLEREKTRYWIVK